MTHPFRLDDVITDEQGRIRVAITPAAGTVLPGGFIAVDPAKAQEHMHEVGWCEYDAPCPLLGGAPNPKITLDNGDVIWGYECWWSPVKRTEVN